jgi:hypothetical protein
MESAMSEQPEPELWSNETIAEFLLNNALSPEGYAWAVQEAVSMGVDPTRLNPDHLDQSEPWARPELYLGRTGTNQKL